MEKKRSAYTSSTLGPSSAKLEPKEKPKETKKARGDCDVSKSTSHTHFYKKEKHDVSFQRITRDQYLGISESISGSSDTFRCVHGPEGKQYTTKGHLKRNLLKELDPVPLDREWNDNCPPSYGWDMAKTLEFLVKDKVGVKQLYRIEAHLRDFAKTANNGYKISVLDSLCVILDFLADNVTKMPRLREGLILLLQNASKPILLNVATEVVNDFDTVRNYMGFLGYLLMRVEDDQIFDLVSNAVIWQLSASDSLRGHGTVQMRHALAAAAPVLYQTTVRMIAVASSHRFPTYMEIALLLACDCVNNCIEMMKENIIENIFYRFNPYFPERDLPVYDINPANLQDYNLKLGDSSITMSTTLSLLLVLLKTIKQFLEDDPKYRLLLPCPDSYAQRCFVWAYRYECRAREHLHERITLTVIASALLHVFGDRLMSFSTIFMPDIMSLSVMTELPPRSDWTSSVNFNTAQADVQFKKLLIYLSVELLKVFPYNKFLVEARYWLMGLMYLLDPGLCYLRARWSPALFAELRKIALQALVCTLPLSPPHLVKDYGLIRRIMWYIEWYSESPYELPVLYWCVRLLQVAIYQRDMPIRKVSIRDLFDTHGIIILMHLCYTLLGQKLPPVEKSQAIIALCLRLLTSAVEANSRLTCCVYTNIKWPGTINSIARKMLDVVLYSLEKHFNVGDRWMISLLNFIWQSIIWKKEFREMFIANNGIYKLLDLIAMSRPPVQCICLALICDVARAGEAVGQLITWRANLGASNAYPNVVKRGATIATLLAAIFRDECQTVGVQINQYGVIQEMENPIMSYEVKREMNTPAYRVGKSQRTAICYAAADLAGSRMSKAFALLHMLSEDLEYRVHLADEAYNLYKNMPIVPEDEALLILCAHYLTLKLNEIWTEVKYESPGLVPQDQNTLEEFLHIGRGWAEEIKRQQEEVINKNRKKEHEEEYSLYAFLGRVRLNIALDALREVRCVARSGDRDRITHALLQDAVRAHHRRSAMANKLQAPILRTYGPSLDDQNLTGQYVKVYSIYPKFKPKPRDNPSSS